MGRYPRVNVTSIEEYTPSRLATDLRRTVRPDNIMEYTPQGNFLRNWLLMTAEIADEYHPPTILARSMSAPYSTIPRNPVLPQRGNVPDGETLAIKVVDDVIGDPEKMGKYWVNQGANGTCLLASVGSILSALGKIDDGYSDLLKRTVVKVNAHGQIVDDSGNVISLSQTGIDILIEGQAPYIQLTEPLTPEVLQRYEGLQPGVTRGMVPGAILPNPNLRQNWGWVETMFDAYNVQNHTGYASNFATVIEELAAENKIVAYVDALELWRSPLTDFIESNDWIPFVAEKSVENHALWITGVEIDAGEAFVILNDSGNASGREAKYPLKKFLKAFEDSEFLYTATGVAAPDNDLQIDRAALQYDINSYHADLLDTSAGLLDDVTKNNFNKAFNALIKDDAFVDRVEATNPGFKARVRDYKGKVNAQKEKALRQIGLDPDSIDDIYEDVDTE
jgi:hypothetical protein